MNIWYDGEPLFSIYPPCNNHQFLHLQIRKQFIQRPAFNKCCYVTAEQCSMPSHVKTIMHVELLRPLQAWMYKWLNWKHSCKKYKRWSCYYLIVHVEWPPETYSVLSNVLLDNNIKSLTVLFRFSDMVEAIAHVPFSMHQYYCTS